MNEIGLFAQRWGTAASEPAPKRDQIKGSDKNKEGSAASSRGRITLSPAIVKALREKVREHNKSSRRKVTIGQLKAVYRRGAGAYSTSHDPKMTRAAWAMARVNAFLRLVASGKPRNPRYVSDNDLL